MAPRGVWVHWYRVRETSFAECSVSGVCVYTQYTLRYKVATGRRAEPPRDATRESVPIMSPKKSFCLRNRTRRVLPGAVSARLRRVGPARRAAAGLHVTVTRDTPGPSPRHATAMPTADDSLRTATRARLTSHSDDSMSLTRQSLTRVTCPRTRDRLSDYVIVSRDDRGLPRHADTPRCL